MRLGILAISLMFLIYGAIRMGVSSLLLMQVFELIDVVNLQDALGEVSAFIQEKNKGSLVDASPTGYICYLWIMGALLIVGGIGCLKRKKFGQMAISAFLLLHALLFINFQTINPKILHLLVCGVLLLVYVWLRNKEEIDQLNEEG